MLDNFQDLQLRPQPQRLQILELLNDLMSQHRSALEEMGNDSIVGITDLASGEKDPRNLMIIFSILKVIMIEWDIATHAEVRRFLSEEDSRLLMSDRHFLMRYTATFLLHSARHLMIPTVLLHRI